MCYEDNCIPYCLRGENINDPTCQNYGVWGRTDSRERGPNGALITSKPVAKAVEKPCVQGDSFVAGSGDGLMCLLGNWLGFECKTERQKADECADYRSHTTGKSYYVNTTCENISDGMPPVVLACYYNVLEGKR